MVSEKYNWRYASELQDNCYQAVWDLQDVQAVCESVGLLADDAASITAAMVIIGDGEYVKVWLSESNAPYDLTAIYRAASWYTDSEPITDCEHYYSQDMAGYAGSAYSN